MLGSAKPPNPPAAPTTPVTSPIWLGNRFGTSWKIAPLPIPKAPIVKNRADVAHIIPGSAATPARNKAAAENNSTIPANNFAVGLTGIVNVTVGPLASSLGFLTTSPIMPAAATDNGGIPNGSGPDFVNFGLVSDADSDSDFIAASPFWVGGGTIGGSVTGSGGFAAQGSADATINFVDFGTKGRVKLTYFFDVIPTPGATALMAVAGLVSVRRRRA